MLSHIEEIVFFIRVPDLITKHRALRGSKIAIYNFAHTSVAHLVANWPPELWVESSIPDIRCEQFWGSKRCLQTLSSTRDVKLRAPCV